MFTKEFQIDRNSQVEEFNLSSLLLGEGGLSALEIGECPFIKPLECGTSQPPETLPVECR